MRTTAGARHCAESEQWLAAQRERANAPVPERNHGAVLLRGGLTPEHPVEPFRASLVEMARWRRYGELD